MSEPRVAVTAGRVFCEFQTVISGAGISRDKPADLPAAEDLAAHVWEALRDSLGRDISDELSKTVSLRLGTMRMEQILELLTGPSAIPPRLVVHVYRLVGNAPFNANHLRLGALDTKHFTLNMDTLLEEAAPGARVIHVHGRWNRPRSIRTTVTHYSRGLSRSLSRKLGRALRDKDVLVIGYSGRDLDVITMFDRYPPRKITWVNRDPGKWEPEVLALQRTYDSDSDREFCVEPKWASEYLPTLVPDVPAPGPRVMGAPPTRLAEDLLCLRRGSRLLAVGQLLFGMGLHNEIHDLLDHRNFHGAVEIRRRKLLARTLSREDRADEALKMLLRRPRGATELWPWLMNINEIAALAGRSQNPRLLRLRTVIGIAGIVIPTRTLRHMRLLAQVRTAQQLSVHGHPRQSVAILRRIVNANRAHWTLGEANYVDALTWYADALKSIGELRKALDGASRAMRLLEYCLPSQAAYAQWKFAEVLAVGGRPDSQSDGKFRAGVMKDIDEALAAAASSEAKVTQGWIHGTAAEILVNADPVEARAHIDAAARLGADAADRDGFARGYHLLQRAVVEVAEGDFDAAATTVASAMVLLEAANVPGAILQCQEVRATIAWLEDPALDLAGELKVLADRYCDADMLLNKARAMVGVASLRGTRVDEETLRAAEEYGWHDVLRRARGDAGPYPWEHDLFL
jgi:SIR2-like domain